MPRTHKDEAPVLVDSPLIQGRYAELDDYTVSFETFPQTADGAPAFRGLPGDRCQCPHWGGRSVRAADAALRRPGGDLPRGRCVLRPAGPYTGGGGGEPDRRLQPDPRARA